MSNKYVYSFVMLLLIGVLLFGGTKLYLQSNGEKNRQEAQITVVTSFYPVYIAVENIIGQEEGVTLCNLSEPQTGCLHDFQLTPEDMKLLDSADVFVINGGGAESFLADVMKRYPELTVIDATKELAEEEEEEDILMHAWMNTGLYEQEIKAILQGLCEICPDKQEAFSDNAAVYLKKVEDLSAQMKELSEQLDQRSVILFSEAYEGLAKQLGLQVVYLLDLDEERQLSSGEVAEVMAAIENQPDSFVIAEELYGSDMGELVNKQTGIPVLYLNTITRGTYEKDSYLVAMQNNIDVLKELVDHETD